MPAPSGLAPPGVLTVGHQHLGHGSRRRTQQGQIGGVHFGLPVELQRLIRQCGVQGLPQLQAALVYTGRFWAFG